jgi:hypothetical protein
VYGTHCDCCYCDDEYPMRALLLYYKAAPRDEVRVHGASLDLWGMKK